MKAREALEKGEPKTEEIEDESDKPLTKKE